jgi:hypothetical protein
MILPQLRYPDDRKQNCRFIKKLNKSGDGRPTICRKVYRQSTKTSSATWLEPFRYCVAVGHLDKILTKGQAHIRMMQWCPPPIQMSACYTSKP